jgi:3-carboxy-cis,cis-muconate cycloisomerase
MSALWDPIFGRSAVASATDDRAWIRSLCQAEAALSVACEAAGLIDHTTANSIVDACTQLGNSEPAWLGAQGAADGNPVNPLVRALRAAAGPQAAASVHLGATSQDILDTASMLVSRAAIEVILRQFEACVRVCVRLAADHRDSVMTGRTLLQQAVPTTFGAVAAGWGEGLGRSAARLRALSGHLCVQLGGAAGTLAGWYPHGAEVRAAFAAELGLADPAAVWHSERSRVAELAAALGIAAASVGKVATDIVLLAQGEIGEVAESAAGTSSAMAHKHNPIAAVTARAGALQAPGLVSTVLIAAASAELQRGAGPWHAEWQPLIELLVVTGGAVERLHVSLDGLQVDRAAMASTLATLINAPVGSAADTGHARDLVDAFCKEYGR